MRIDKKYRWYAVYTRSRHEKKVAEQFTERGIEVYLPLQKKLHVWKDRRKWIDEPFIRSYVFVKISLREYFDSFSIVGLVKYITFEDKVVPVQEKQLESIKILLASDSELELTSESFAIGDPFEVRAGPFANLKGEIIEHRGKKRVLVRIDHIGTSILATIPTFYLKKIMKIIEQKKKRIKKQE